MQCGEASSLCVKDKALVHHREASHRSRHEVFETLLVDRYTEGKARLKAYKAISEVISSSHTDTSGSIEMIKFKYTYLV